METFQQFLAKVNIGFILIWDFIVDIPSAPFDSATALPVQIFLWADSPERGFEEKMSAAIIVLLAFLIIMNALAVFLRQRFETRW